MRMSDDRKATPLAAETYSRFLPAFCLIYFTFIRQFFNKILPLLPAFTELFLFYKEREL
jgi:hypothetical protein